MVQAEPAVLRTFTGAYSASAVPMWETAIGAHNVTSAT